MMSIFSNAKMLFYNKFFGITVELLCKCMTNYVSGFILLFQFGLATFHLSIFICTYNNMHIKQVTKHLKEHLLNVLLQYIVSALFAFITKAWKLEGNLCQKILMCLCYLVFLSDGFFSADFLIMSLHVIIIVVVVK